MVGTEFEKAAIVSSDISTEWKTYHQLFIKQPKDDISMQLKELLTNNMLIALVPNLHKLMLVYSHFYSISRTKFLRHEINTVIDLPKNSLIVIWKKLLTCGIEKVDGLLCKLSFRLLSHYVCILSLLMHFVKHAGTKKVPRRSS